MKTLAADAEEVVAVADDGTGRLWIV